MERHLFLLIAGLAAMPSSASGAAERGAGTAASAPAARASEPVVLAAGPGRIEPESEDIQLGSELSGKLQKVEAEEGDGVRRGQVLAALENDDYRAAVRLAEAEVRIKEAALRKLLNGARPEERVAARAAVDEAAAVLENSRVELVRARRLFAAGATTNADLERAEWAARVSEAQHRQAFERESLIAARPREEDRVMAAAEVDLARARLAQAQAYYEKTLIRSPIDGTVLRRHHRAGESVSSSATRSDPVFTVGNQSTLRVRVEIDESDISRVALGQRAYASADAYAGRKFWGHVLRLGQQLGRKNVHTDEPTERVDTKVLEVLVELEAGTVLPAGLRVDAFFVRDSVR